MSVTNSTTDAVDRAPSVPGGEGEPAGADGPASDEAGAASSAGYRTAFGDLAEFIVTAGEVDAVGPARGRTTLRSYFEELA